MTTSEFLETVERLHLLASNQFDEVRRLATANDNAQSLADELIQNGCLTPFQADLLLQYRGDELLLGSYVLLDKIGEGGMGAVYKARNWKLDRVCAVKLIRKDRLKSRDAVRRFYREIRAAAQLDHPNVVRAYDGDSVNGVHYFAMEYVEGVDLAKLVKDYGPAPVKLSCEYIRQAALGLQHAHERGLVHRDIKPANLLLVRSGGNVAIKILDMGLARQDETSTGHSGTITQVGMVMGTPDYMAPEQSVASHSVDIRADLYSLGCSLYFLLTGNVPFPGGSLTEKLVKHQSDEPAPIAQYRPDVPSAVAELIARLMAKKRDERFSSPGELAAELETMLKTPQIWEAVGASHTAQPVPGTASTQSSQFRTDPFWQSIVAEAGNQTVDFAPSVSRKAVIAFAGAAAAVLLLIVWVMQLAYREPIEPDDGLPNGKIRPGKSATQQQLLRPAPALAPFNELIAKEHQMRWAKYLNIPIQMKNSIGMKLVLIPPGAFDMGAGPEEMKRFLAGIEGQKNIDKLRARYRQHRVRLTRPFYIGAIEVTKKNWYRVRNGTTKFPWLAAEGVSWENAMEFCRKLSELPEEKEAGRRFRLPTDAEWEYVCRAGTTTPYAFGNQLTLKDAAISERGRPNRSRPGTRKPNAWGIFDVHGGQLEWCADWFGDYGSKEVEYDPLGPPMHPKERRVIRGGSHGKPAINAMSAYRGGVVSGANGKDFGFRVVCEIDEGWIDLLAGVDPTAHGIRGHDNVPNLGGEWQRIKEGIRSPGRQWSRLKLPVWLSRDYRLEVSFTPRLTKNENRFMILLPVAGRSVSVRFRHGGRPILHKGWTNKKEDALVKESSSMVVTNQRYIADIRVMGQDRDVRIEVRLDGKLLTTWTGSPDVLLERTWAQSTRDQIWLMPWMTIMDFHSVRLRRLPAQADGES